MRKGFLLGPASKPTEDTKPAGSAETDKKVAEKNEAAEKKVAEGAAAATQPTPEKVKSYFWTKILSLPLIFFIKVTVRPVSVIIKF
jgi:hypothetical protein